MIRRAAFADLCWAGSQWTCNRDLGNWTEQHLLPDMQQTSFEHFLDAGTYSTFVKATRYHPGRICRVTLISEKNRCLF